MSLNFYADEALTLQITAATPKRFLFPNKGGTKTSQVWLGDPYKTTCAAHATAGDNIIDLADTSEFLEDTEIAGTTGGYAVAISGANVIHYTGKTQSQLTGVTGITVDIAVGDVVYPHIVYKGINGANVEVFPIGADQITFGVRVAVGTTTTLGFPGLPAIFPNTEIQIGVANALEVFLSVKIPAGVDSEFVNVALQANNLFLRDVDDATAFSTSEGTIAPQGALYAFRHDYAIKLPIRILPLNRRVLPDTPGFIVGEYRWRDDNNRNATALVPTNWDMDPNTIGLEKFIAGIGDQDDLTPEELVEIQDSINMIIHRGEYFTGSNRYYLPADWNLEFLGCSEAAANVDETVTLHTLKTPRDTAPVFVGTYILDNQQYYEKGLGYKYVATLTNPDGSPRTDLPDRYFQLDRKTNTITLNKSLGHAFVFLGSVSGEAVDYFDIPVYPVDAIDVVYVDQGPNQPALYATAWTFDKEQGTIQLPSIPGALAGQPVFAICAPAVAVLYDAGPDETREITTVDFNPAFSGLASGVFYLQHRRQKPASLVLSCDKPRIAIPATQASIIGLVAFGPVYFENDFALLSVTAFGPVSGETIPNAHLVVDVDNSTFTGTINYKNPLSETVEVITGGDGTANLIFVPASGFGVWIPTIAAAGGLGGLHTTTITNDTLVLPADVPLSQIWNAQEGWIVTTYNVLNNDPLFGMVGGDPALGEIVWQTFGTPGAPGYKTNGERRAWRTDDLSIGELILPIDAKDSAGHSYTSAAFNGSVRSLIFATAVETSGDIGAYFLTFTQRVLVRMRLKDSNTFSNYILLQMDVPQLIVENPWLVLDDSIQGRLEQFRLGYVKSH